MKKKDGSAIYVIVSHREDCKFFKVATIVISNNIKRARRNWHLKLLFIKLIGIVRSTALKNARVD